MKFDKYKFIIFGSYDVPFINFYFKIYKMKFDTHKFGIFGSYLTFINFYLKFTKGNLTCTNHAFLVKFFHFYKFLI